MILSTDTHVDAGQLWTYSFSRFYNSNLESIATPCFQTWKQEQQQADICLGNVSKGGEVLTQLISRMIYLLPLVRNTQSHLSPVDP